MSPILKIKKRDGSIADFDQAKITEAVWKAAQSVGGTDKTVSTQISNQVAAVLEVFYKDDTNIPSVEQIQDLIEKILIEGGHAKTAKAYILYREEHKKIRKTQEDILGGKVTKLPLSVNALRVFAGRYLQRDDNGEICETPEERISTASQALANVELDYGKNEEEIQEITSAFHDIMFNFEFLPGGRTLANAGGKTRLVANCIVLHPQDSMDGIFTTLKDAALLQQAGSGLGFPWHILRPAGTHAKKTQGVASGPVSFMKAYNEAFGVIKQQGRHGANMGVMRVDHPDILEFIDSKWEEGSIVNFNISVSLTDAFMNEVKSQSKEPWFCDWNGEKMKPRRIVRNNRGAFIEAIEETMTASELMDRIIEAAWRNGEPGVLFPDAANRANPIPELGRLEATNPCGEQWLHDGDVCNLGSMNLGKFVKDGKINFERMKFVTETAVRFLDNVIDLSDFPVDRINKTFKNNRRVGLGIMGFADMLYQLKVAYNSEEGVKIARQVMKFVNDTAHSYSAKLAEEKDTFPNWKISIYGPNGSSLKMRNSALTTVAPTGSISMLADCCSGIEPFFALAYYKEVMNGQKMMYLNPYLENALAEYGLNNEEVKSEIYKTGSLQNIAQVPAEIKTVFVTAMDISAEYHIKMQAAFQEHVDNSISKTINFPYSATREDVRQGYIMAWEAGVKGCTVYRDGSRQEQVLNLHSEEQKTEQKTLPTIKPVAKKIENQQNFEEVIPPPLPLDQSRAHLSLNKKEIIASKKCPECGCDIQIAEGCMLCLSCGFSVCSV
jgi:ribonucleoside-diphosphate reductase alpha chain